VAGRAGPRARPSQPNNSAHLIMPTPHGQGHLFGRDSVHTFTIKSLHFLVIGTKVYNQKLTNFGLGLGILFTIRTLKRFVKPSIVHFVPSRVQVGPLSPLACSVNTHGNTRIGDAPHRLAVSQSIWAHQLGEPGLFPAPKTRVCTANPAGQIENSLAVNASEAELAGRPLYSESGTYTTVTRFHPWLSGKSPETF